MFKIGELYIVITTAYDYPELKQSGQVGIYVGTDHPKHGHTESHPHWLEFKDIGEWNYRSNEIRPLTKLERALR